MCSQLRDYKFVGVNRFKKICNPGHYFTPTFCTDLFDLDPDRDLLRLDREVDLFDLDLDLFDLERDLRSRDRDLRERLLDLDPDRDLRDREVDLRRCER